MRVSKTDSGLVSDLADQLVLLDEHLKRIRGGEVLSVKIVAPILRDLVCVYRSNPEPLLFYIAEKHSHQLMVELDVPPTMPSVMTLDDCLKGTAFASGTEGVLVTHYQLIKRMADQQSVAHTDKGIDNEIFAAMGWPESKATAYSPHVVSLVGTGEVILSSAYELMEVIEANNQ